MSHNQTNFSWTLPCITRLYIGFLSCICSVVKKIHCMYFTCLVYFFHKINLFVNTNLPKMFYELKTAQKKVKTHHFNAFFVTVISLLKPKNYIRRCVTSRAYILFPNIPTCFILSFILQIHNERFPFYFSPNNGTIIKTTLKSTVVCRYELKEGNRQQP